MKNNMDSFKEEFKKNSIPIRLRVSYDENKFFFSGFFSSLTFNFPLTITTLFKELFVIVGFKYLAQCFFFVCGLNYRVNLSLRILSSPGRVSALPSVLLVHTYRWPSGPITISRSLPKIPSEISEENHLSVFSTLKFS